MEGLRQAWIESKIRAAKAAVAPRGKKPNPAGVDVSPAERSKYLEEVYGDTDIKDKPRNLIGIAKSIPDAQMEEMLRSVAPVGDEQLRQLADARAQAVYENCSLTRAWPSASSSSRRNWTQTASGRRRAVAGGVLSEIEG